MPLLDSVTDMVRKVLGTTNDAAIRRLWPQVLKVRALEPMLAAEDDAALRARVPVLREKAAKQGLDAVLVEALALAREVADRRLGMWNALNPAAKFPQDAWGELEPLVESTRRALQPAQHEKAEKPALAAGGTISQAQAQAGAAAAAPPKPPEPWSIDLPAAYYAKVRSLYPESQPPFRMRAHDVQILGAIVLHQGRIAEMRTGEGKTLVASLACFLNAMAGTGVHVVTVNDYLAARDAAWNSPTLRFLGVSIGAIQAGMPQVLRKEIYQRDVVYGTNTEFGFDYLRDNLVRALEDQVQTRRVFAIVDEVDSILIDEARTPLIISGPAVGRQDFYQKANEVAQALEKGTHYEVELKDRHVTLTDAGMDRATELFGVSSMYDAESMHIPHFLDNALKAKELYIRDKAYLVSGELVKIVDEHTGRTLEGRRWSEGLHQAIEAKEGVRIQEENQTYGTITLQNFFRLYAKLAGMTGTALTEASEFSAIYKLEVISIPPNKPVKRLDLPDLIYGSEKEKFDAILHEVQELHALGQPVLVGTISVDVSERLSELFKQKGIPHNVLNARQDLVKRESEIVASAGQFGAITIATNMAGRGTDIILGKAPAERVLQHWQAHELLPGRMGKDTPASELDVATVDLWSRRWLDEKERGRLKPGAGPEELLRLVNERRRKDGYAPLPLPARAHDGLDVRQLGGLRIIGSERHDSRRIDNQLRGRSGRQGDPGSSRFFLSLDDDLMKRFAGQGLAGLMRKMGLRDGIPIESKLVSNSVEKAQKRVEEFYFGHRKVTLEYDQVLNSQRLLIYKQRQMVLEGKDLDKTLTALMREGLDDLIQRCAGEGQRGPDLAKKIADTFTADIGLPAPPLESIPVKDGGEACLVTLFAIVETHLAARRTEYGPMWPDFLRAMLLSAIDTRWKDHLYAIDHLRGAIGLVGYAQQDPRVRFKQEGFRLFLMMNELVRGDVAKHFFRSRLVREPPSPPERALRMGLESGGFRPLGEKQAARPAEPGRATGLPPPQGLPQVNAPRPRSAPPPTDPCPCGSGQQYRHCHGK